MYVILLETYKQILLIITKIILNLIHSESIIYSTEPCWAMLQKSYVEGDNIMTACRRLETVGIEMYSRSEWRFTLCCN
jgi:hypothetical protein